MKVVCFTPEEFEAVANYINSMPVPFQRSKQAADVLTILTTAQVKELIDETKADDTV